MASTYSTNLAIELIGTGEQSGTWGTTTNTNLGTLIEQSISGYVTQAITDGSGANTTITIPNGTTGVARNMFIEMTGALSFSTTSLIVPANKKMYFIFNNTTGGFAVTVKVSGQTGILVPNGKKVILTSNGTDIVEAHTAIVGNATMGGTLGITGTTTAAAINASGLVAMAGAATVGTTLGVSGTSTMAAINASGLVAMAGAATVGTTLGVTGVATFTAAPVISAITNIGTLTLPTSTDTLVGRATTDTLTNKTLTAPVLGTPASGILTSCTGLNYDGFKNRIINGAMVIDARNAGASVATTVTGTPTYTLDRFAYQSSQASKYTVQQNAAAVTPPTGFSNYLGVTSTSAYSVLTGDYFLLRQPIEGFNTADLGFGTASASTVTLSFWVRSSLTGTFGGSLGNGSRSYPFSYTISVANTWEQKSITIAGDTSGTWVGATNAVGMILAFSLGMGSTYSTTAGAWAAGNYLSATGATSVVGTSGATFYITGVQLEKGSTATSFDYRPYGTEFQLCQRYYEKNSNVYCSLVSDGANNAMLWVQFSVQKRASPTMSQTGAWNYSRSGASGSYSLSFIQTDVYGSGMYGNCGAAWVVVQATGANGWIASSEL
jgi:hypothetical protein